MEKLVIVTGYGQFAGHEVNASGEAVKLLPEKIEIGDVKYKIKKIEIQVSYDCVDKALEHIWSIKPHLVIHCGK
jgi:pyrrolidone-carboxylate peptidase